MRTEILVWVRGAGELGSATALILHRSGFPVILSELEIPLAIRRSVAFSDTMIQGEATVEKVKAVRCNADAIREILARGQIPMVVDDPDEISISNPRVLVDARMLKRPSGDKGDIVSFTIGLGPGFQAGEDCHAVIETKRGHDMGKVLWEGTAYPDTGTPGEIGGERDRRVVYAPAAGSIKWSVDFGNLVKENDLLGIIGETTEIRSPLGGIVRGLISPKVLVVEGMKIGDIDPRGQQVDFYSISDKARSVGRGVLEAILISLNLR